MFKRKHATILHECSKKLKQAVAQQTSSSGGILEDTEAALVYLKNKFPADKYEGILPPIILVHQLYSVVKNKTKVDNELNSLKIKGKIKVFKLGGEVAALAAVFTDDLVKHIDAHCAKIPAAARFVKQVLLNTQDICVDKRLLREEHGFSEKDIRELMNCGLLALRLTTSYWFSFPNAGKFVTAFERGRKSMIQTIKKCKFSEILQSELEQRKLEKSVKLGVPYHIHDIIGAELVHCVNTTSGTLLRLVDK